MIKLLTLLIVIGIAYATYYASSWRLTGELKRRSVRLRDPDLAPVLERLARGLGKQRIEVHLYDEPSINGLTAPDGRVYITEGLYGKYRKGEVSAEEIASVIAHEFGHVAMGHSQRRMLDMTGANAMRMVLVVLVGRFIPFVGGWIADGLARMLAAALSRRDEYEADKYAAALLKEAGIGTEPQISLLGKLERMTGSFGRPPAWLMSHPPTEDRINAILALDEVA
jgi:putative metalloprotease